MAEIVLERWTRCPTGNPADEIAFEIVLADDDARPASNRTARTTNVVRLFSRGDLRAVSDRSRDILLTSGKRESRTITRAARLSTAHLDVDVSSLGLTLTFPLGRSWAQGWDAYIGPARGADAPSDATTFDTYVTRTKTDTGTRTR